MASRSSTATVGHKTLKERLAGTSINLFYLPAIILLVLFLLCCTR